MKNLLLVTCIAFFALDISAQVTIGSDIPPEKAALLDIKTQDGGTGSVSSEGGGLLLPRVEISILSDFSIFGDITGVDTSNEKLKHRGLTVYNIGTNDVEEGIYVWDGYKWQKSGLKKKINFFYMPSIIIDLTQPPVDIDLYNEYAAQFDSPKASNPTADTSIPYFESADELNYYATDYDTRVFDSVSITDAGILTYTLKDPLPDDVCCSYINIVFVPK